MDHPETILKLRFWRLLTGKRLQDVAREVRLPVYIVSAIERGEIVPPERWARHFSEAYGDAVASELLAPIEPLEALGPASGSVNAYCGDVATSR